MDRLKTCLKPVCEGRIMNNQVAVIGADDVVEKIMGFQDDFQNLVLKSMPYVLEDEIPSLLKEATGIVDVILFAGPVPYFIAKSLGEETIPNLYVSFTGTSFMQILFQVFNQSKIDVTGISVDILEEKVVLETMNELGLSNIELYTKEYSGIEQSDELVKFHLNLWKEGKTSIALSCLRSSYWKLLDEGVQAYRIVPTSTAIREALKRAVVHGEQLQSKETQIAVQICDIDGYSDLIQNYNFEYKGQRIKLSFQQILNDYAERTLAAVNYEGGDRLTIFTTRGILEKITNLYRNDPLLDEIRERLSIAVSIGTGLGRTAYDATRNAQNALRFAKDAGGDCSYVMTDIGKMIGPIGKEPRLESVVISTDPNFVRVAKKAGMSIETISKLNSLMNLLGKQTLTSHELATGFQISNRSASRILNRLLKAELVSLIGTAQSSPTGQ